MASNYLYLWSLIVIWIQRISIEMQKLFVQKLHLKMSPKCLSFCPGFSMLTHWPLGDFNEILNRVIFKLILMIGGSGFWWMSLDLTGDKSILIQVMAWCRQATSHYLSQCWPSSRASYGGTRPQWVKQLLFAVQYDQVESIIFYWKHPHLMIGLQQSSLTRLCTYRCRYNHIHNNNRYVNGSI